MATDKPPREPWQAPYEAEPLSYETPPAPGAPPPASAGFQVLIALLCVGATIVGFRRYGMLVGGVMLLGVLMFGLLARSEWGWRAFLFAVLIPIGLCVLAVGACFAAVIFSGGIGR